MIALLSAARAGLIAIAVLTGAEAAFAQAGDAVRRGEAVYLDADQLVEDRNLGVYIARGSVRMRSDDRVLLADEIEYRPSDGRVIARGSVRIFQGDAPAQTASEVELDDALAEGVALGFATLLENNGRAAAAFAIRRRDGSVELTNAYYTACDLCEDGSDDPTWRLRARRVVRDVDDQMIYYRDARLEVLGAPVFYTPLFAHPDPSTPAKSGLLIPTVDVSNRLGWSWQQPYLHVLSPYQDIVVSPRLMGKVEPLLGLETRRRFYSGQVNLAGSITHEQEFDNDGLFGEEKFRGHFFGEGIFRIDPVWRWGFGAQWASDDLFLRRYGYNEFRDENGMVLQADDRRLISQLFIRGRSERFYADAAVGRLQSLLENEDDDALPTFAPVAQFRYRAPVPEALGRVAFDASTAVLEREDGDDYARASVQLEWERPAILRNGIRLEPFLLGRVDAYSIRERGQDEAEGFTRGLGLIGAEATYPLVKETDWGQALIIPRLQLSAATGVSEDEVPTNEDSLSVDLDRSLLFERTRAAGYDIWEDGARIDAGVSFVADAGRDFQVEAFLGRSTRIDGDPVFAVGSGLVEDGSDWVAEVEANFGDWRIETRNRIDADDGDLNRTDFRARGQIWRVGTSAVYTRFGDDEVEREVREQLNTRFSYDINKRWSVEYAALVDLDADTLRRQQAALVYRDECTDVRLVYERDTFQVGAIGPSENLTVRVTLFTLGGFGD